MAMQGMQLRPLKKEEQDRYLKEFETLSEKLNLNQTEKTKLKELVKMFNASPEFVAATIFFTNATPHRLDMLKEKIEV